MPMISGLVIRGKAGMQLLGGPSLYEPLSLKFFLGVSGPRCLLLTSMRCLLLHFSAKNERIGL
jgi:hypothetical protein